MTDETMTITAARAAWARLRSNPTYHDWLLVGEALQIGRANAMREARTNRPKGRGYNTAFSMWLRDNGFADTDSMTRLALLTWVENRDAIASWYETLAHD